VTHEPPPSHLDLDRLADLDEDLLSPDDATASERHLAECATCRQRQADIRTTRALLSTLPQESMPDAVASRIDAALAALPATTIVPLAAKRRGWRAHPTAAGLGAAATVAALVAALVIGRTHHSSTPHDNSEAAGAAGAGAPSSVALPTSAVSGTDYTAANLARTVPALLAPPQSAKMAVSGGAVPSGSPGPATAAGVAPATGVPAPLTRLFGSAAALQACVRSVEAGGPSVEPLAIDFATYQGAPSVLIVLPGLEQGHIDAWFVGPGCTAAQENLLDYKSVPTSSPTPSPGG
jgi:hypothetical protein